MSDTFELTPADLTRQCADDPFDFESTADLEPLDRVIGQRRAIEAIDFGLNMKGPGYHIFVTGPEGTGKSTIIRDILTGHAAGMDTPADLCMVNNFDDESCPRVFEMPAGTAVFFARRMVRFIENIRGKLPRTLASQPFQERQAALRKNLADQQQALFSRVEEAAGKMGVGIVKTEQGFQPVPMAEGKPVPPEVFQSYEPEEKAAIQARLQDVHQKMAETMKETRQQAQEMKETLSRMAEAAADNLLSEEIALAFSDFYEKPKVRQFLDEVRQDMKDNLPLLLKLLGSDEEQTEKTDSLQAFFDGRYEVNVLMDRRGTKGAPVIFELNPTYHNLFGKIEKMAVPGAAVSDFTMVQAGALLRAHRGFLVLEVDALVRQPLIWETLKTTLQSRKLTIQDMPDQPGLFATALKPEPIPVDVKVVLVGSYDVFRALQGADPKFNKIFQVRADFDHEADVTTDSLMNYARFVAGVCKNHNLKPFSPVGVAAVVAHGNRLAEDQRKLSLRFGKVLSVIKEADYWASADGVEIIDDIHVEKALDAYRFRHNLYEEKVQERYDDNSILLDVTGQVVGQVNALAVYQIGEIAFGRPSRITAESFMGKPGIVNVEHEADMSGQTHDKGVMIVAGYLGRMFAQMHPLSVSVSITFEQSYSGIDGDSASSTELYAVLSSLSGCPIRQGIAVTGSVNQKGEIQSIGGVNEKIEGFFDVCLKKGLTGDQGVMIPASNVNNLILRRDVIEAVEQGRFHIYRVSTIGQGIQVLTGMAAGEPDDQNNFPADTVFGRAQNKLKSFHVRSVKYCK
ncbi:MAG: AAA family ATPase [Desulfobacterales bacterium]|nr:AAA family ATPase [Desulfobacterales bacterium]